MTKLSRPTVVGLIHDMENECEVVKAGTRSSTGGRAPILYKINPDVSFAVGIDFEFPEIRMAICDLEYRVLCTSKEICDINMDKAQTIERLIKQLETLIDQAGIEQRKLIGIGIGLPGVIDLQNNTSVRIEKIDGWENVPIASILSDHFCLPVYIQNDINLLTLAERQLWPDSDMRNMMCIVIRTGVGLGIIVNDHIFNGEAGNAGRIGHLSVNFEGLECVCGGRGCLTLYTSERAMKRNYEKKTGQRIETCIQLSNQADQNDLAAVQVIESAGWYMGLAIVNLVNLFDVTNVVVLTAFDSTRILCSAQRSIDSRSELFRKRTIKLYAGRLREPMYAMGGCTIVLDHHRKAPKLRTAAGTK